MTTHMEETAYILVLVITTAPHLSRDCVSYRGVATMETECKPRRWRTSTAGEGKNTGTGLSYPSVRARLIRLAAGVLWPAPAGVPSPGNMKHTHFDTGVEAAVRNRPTKYPDRAVCGQPSSRSSHAGRSTPQPRARSVPFAVRNPGLGVEKQGIGRTAHVCEVISGTASPSSQPTHTQRRFGNAAEGGPLAEPLAGILLASRVCFSLVQSGPHQPAKQQSLFRVLPSVCLSHPPCRDCSRDHVENLLSCVACFACGLSLTNQTPCTGAGRYRCGW